MKRRGLKPKDRTRKAQHRDGYGTPAEVAQKHDISGATVYAWVRDGKLEPIGGKPAAKKIGANLWVLFASVERHLMPVKAAVRAAS
jgi:transposase-like protein